MELVAAGGFVVVVERSELLPFLLPVPCHRDVPWLNLLLFAAGLILLGGRAALSPARPLVRQGQRFAVVL
jgi:hypothetical protein